MRILVEYKIISDDHTWESDWGCWEMGMNIVEYCVHRWLSKRTVFHPNTVSRFLFDREFQICNDRIEANKAELFTKVGKGCNVSEGSFIDWYFYEPNREYAKESRPFIRVHKKEVERMLREVAKGDETNLVK